MYTREDYPADWARTQLCLGVALYTRPAGDKRANPRRAAEACEAALTVFTRRDYRVQWAHAQSGRGRASQEMPDDHCSNLRVSIACYKAALLVFTVEAFPALYADVTEFLPINTELYELNGCAAKLPAPDIAPAE